MDSDHKLIATIVACITLFSIVLTLCITIYYSGKTSQAIEAGLQEVTIPGVNGTRWAKEQPQ